MNTATRLFGILTVAASALASGHLFAAPKSDTPLTLAGCVVEGQGKDTFLITNVTVDGSAPANAFYRLDSTKELRDRVGQRVEIAGTVDFGDLDKGKLKVDVSKKGQRTTVVESERKTVKVEDHVWVGSEGAAKMKANIATYPFEVKSVKRVDGNCK
jgi:hypothetical protein